MICCIFVQCTKCLSISLNNAFLFGILIKKDRSVAENLLDFIVFSFTQSHLSYSLYGFISLIFSTKFLLPAKLFSSIEYAILKGLLLATIGSQ